MPRIPRKPWQSNYYDPAHLRPQTQPDAQLDMHRLSILKMKAMVKISFSFICRHFVDVTCVRTISYVDVETFNAHDFWNSTAWREQSCLMVPNPGENGPVNICQTRAWPPSNPANRSIFQHLMRQGYWFAMFDENVIFQHRDRAAPLTEADSEAAARRQVGFDESAPW